jgi:hypothetical protein
VKLAKGSKGFKPHELRKIERIVKEERESFIGVWNAYFKREWTWE